MALKNEIFLKIIVKYISLIIVNKCFVIIKTLFLSVIYSTPIIRQKKLLNKLISKYKYTPIIYIIQ